MNKLIIILLSSLLFTLSLNGVSDESPKVTDQILLHVKKGVIVDGIIQSFKIKNLFKEFDYKIKDIVYRGDYVKESDNEITIEIFICRISDPQNNLQVFCDFLEQEKDIIKAEAIDPISKADVEIE